MTGLCARELRRSEMNLRSAVARLIALIASRALPARVMRRKEFFRLWEERGYHVTPVHFYEPLPDTRTLKDHLWSVHSSLAGVRIREEAQLKFLQELVEEFKEEYEVLPREKTGVPHQYYVNNTNFESVDGEILYCTIRRFKPERIFEIGSGHSTYLSAQAVLKNRRESGRECEFIAFEPYPNEVLAGGFPGLSKVVPVQAQDIPLSEFGRLKENDILFIDSSHVLKIGSDVQYEYLEVIPRLNRGVLVHLHDIFLPAEYRREWIFKNYKFWNEQYLLQAFLAFNDGFEVLWAGSYMHLKHPDKLRAAFSSYEADRTWPGSFWMRRK